MQYIEKSNHKIRLIIIKKITQNCFVFQDILGKYKTKLFDVSSSVM